MTAEIAVMNKGAIALAADSKVTVTTGGVTKTYDTVSKLFTLSKVAPIGIMIYGSAEFMGYPWETIIKMYRQQKRGATEATVADWAEDFFTYLDTFGKVTKEHKDGNVRNICLSTLSKAVDNFHDVAVFNGLSHGTDEYEGGLRVYLQGRLERVAANDPWVTANEQTALSKQLAPNVAQAVDTYLKGYSEETREAGVLLLLGTLLLKASSPQVTGVVVAGFGDDEYFPSLIEYRTDGYVGRKIKRFRVPPDVDVARTSPACIRAFAQKEMVQRFMNGIDPFYELYLDNGIPELVVDNCFATLSKYGMKKNDNESVREEIREAVMKAVEKFEEDAAEYRRTKFSLPVIRMVSVLPKDELAHLAESLVALTSLKRRVSSDAETVGGPIDVALISKGDGFIWIKRKHYFQDDLNHQFSRTYMNGVFDGENEDAKRGPAQSGREASQERPSPRITGAKSGRGKGSTARNRSGA
jgi:hypothetical protein